MSSESNIPILELDSVRFAYAKDLSFIDGLSFSVGEGEFIGLLGPNGSGKSTVLRIGSGILRPSSGGIRLWGKSLHTYANRDRAKLISYLPQVLDLSVPFTVRELVSMGLYPYDILPAITTEDALEMVGLKDKAGSSLSDLSGGERRRTFIAMTLLQGAGLLLLDEPLANLDIRYQMELVRLLWKLREDRHISIVMALHDINIALQFERVMLIKEGRLLGIGHPKEILTKDMLRDAFGVAVEISRTDTGNTYVSYENNF
jgi:iron complex transport system ATP-binding protein